MNPFKSILEHQREHVLVYRLLIYIMLCSISFTLIASMLQVYLDYKKDVRLIETRIEQIEKSYLQGLTLSVWNIDTELTQNLLSGILALPDIQYVAVLDENNKIFVQTGSLDGKHGDSRRFRLEHINDRGQTTYIGTLVVTPSLEGVYQRMKERSLVILGTQAVNTFFIAAIILFLIQYFITRHLKSMASYTKNLELENLDRPLTLNRRKLIVGTPDELDRVSSAINEMVEKLKHSAREMQIKARMEGELNAAAKVQRSFSPVEPGQLKGYDIASLFYPAREVSGDYYDFIRISEKHIAMVVADVSGKGVSAAMYANIARVLIHDKSETFFEPVELMRSLNNRLRHEITGPNFLTMSYILLDLHSAEVTYANAGHEPLVLIKGDGGPYSLLKPSGYPFCEPRSDAFNEHIQQETYYLGKGDLIFCYTDGLTDVVNENGEMFGEERLYHLVNDHYQLSTKLLLRTIYESIQSFQGSAEQTDDITMIALKRTTNSGRPRN